MRKLKIICAGCGFRISSANAETSSASAADSVTVEGLTNISIQDYHALNDLV